MIALIRGEVAVRRPDHVVILCGGIGYRLAVSAHTMALLPGLGQSASLHTHLIARDDGLSLYGFASETERELFLMLLSVQSVGPKVALAVLSGGPPGDLLGALAAGDATRFQAVPGIGKRTAQRIVTELADRAGVTGDPAGEIVVSRRDEPHRLARDGLLGLGLASVEAEHLLAGAVGDTAEALIADALRRSHAPRERA